MAVIIADSGSTKCEWRIVSGRTGKSVFTQGISPYFLSPPQIEGIMTSELLPHIRRQPIEAIYYYGTGCLSSENVALMKKVIRKLFPKAEVYVSHDLMGAARGLCLDQKGIACILGTGSNSCYYNGKKIVYNSPGLGYVLGDEGSGAYLGKKVVQYYLYRTFEKDIKDRFDEKYRTSASEILENVYKKPLPNRYLASFSKFLSENRGHFMIENIIEDGLNDFFFNHLLRYKESGKYPVHFVGSVAFNFRDVVSELCDGYGFELGNIFQSPISGLVAFHQQ